MRALILAKSVLALTVFSVAPPAEANDSPIRNATECVPAKDIIKLLSKFDKMKPERRDTVDVAFIAKFIITEGELPERFYMVDGETEVPFTIAGDGRIPDFMNIKTGSKAAELCVDDPSRAGMNRDEDGSSFDIDIEVKFKQATGVHSLTDIIDGASDGKSFYKKIVPGPVKLLIPKMTHIGITYDDPDTPANIRAVKGETEIEGLVIEPYHTMHVIEVKQLKSLGTERLLITGGPYKMEPVPSVEKMKSFGFGDNSDADRTEERDNE